jgi:hypothetical protein
MLYSLYALGSFVRVETYFDASKMSIKRFAENIPDGFQNIMLKKGAQ